MTRICQFCGEKFEPLKHERTCPACKSFKRHKDMEPGSALAECVKNAAESMHKITLILQQASAAGLSYGQYVAEIEREKIMAKGLSKEKIEEVQALIESGATRKEIAVQAGVGLATVDRIKSGQLTAEGKATTPAPKPKPDVGRGLAPAATLKTVQERISPRELDALRVLISQAVKAFAGIECATAADSYNLGQTFGLLTAAQMILEVDET